MPARILIIEPEPEARDSLQLLLAPEGYEIACTPTAPEAVFRLAEAAADVIFCDLLLTSDDAQASLVRWLCHNFPATPVIATSGTEGESWADRARREGAYDHLARPFCAPSVLHAVERALDRRRLACGNALLRRELRLSVGDRPIVAASSDMVELLESVERAAPFQVPTLIVGEPGSGKEGLARLVHAQSPRRSRPFVAVCCTSGSEEDLEHSLFGRAMQQVGSPQPVERGLLLDAEGGTVFLDEVSALPARIQTMLLRAIQEESIHPRGAAKPRAVDVRVIASTCRDLHASVAIGDFSPDLLEQLESVQFSVPALRDRPQDIPLLADHFFARARARFGRALRCISDEALEPLVAYAWPGNVRELENVIERAVLVAKGNQLRRADLPDVIVCPAPNSPDGCDSGLALRPARKRLEAHLIRRALLATGGNRTHAARLLGISHRALLYKMNEYRSEID